ncbi:hypothetical protein V6N12_024085 [Hibiscus sabdariffa]|uniref:GPI ethanolamine phosphate transferase 3 n=1 Tax=Hibiscus sabdariffa TaxID=183260 RepID=A0ABR2G084_9ROSI
MQDQAIKGLTTGALPTFIDVGNSFGAPAIVEDNFIKQIDNGCIEHLLPSLHQQDWDVLIAHFLGVDHVGHIYGVDSTPMIEKLEQYNAVLEKVIEEIQNQSGPGKLHENSLLLVMGDHGQTLNGDHGGGSPEELDFAVTVSSLLGVPFPFGSIGRVNPELYALAVGTWNLDDNKTWNNQDETKLEEWLQNYVNVICTNSWQVKRYIDVYSASSVIGFSSEDLFHISDLYAKAKDSRLNLSFNKNESSNTSLPFLKKQIVAYFEFLSYVAELARSKWTEFNLKMMGTVRTRCRIRLGGWAKIAPPHPKARCPPRRATLNKSIFTLIDYMVLSSTFLMLQSLTWLWLLLYQTVTGSIEHLWALAFRKQVRKELEIVYPPFRVPARQAFPLLYDKLKKAFLYLYYSIPPNENDFLSLAHGGERVAAQAALFTQFLDLIGTLPSKESTLGPSSSGMNFPAQPLLRRGLKRGISFPLATPRVNAHFGIRSCWGSWIRTFA